MKSNVFWDILIQNPTNHTGTMKNKGSVLSILLLCLIVVVFFVILNVCSTPSVVEASPPPVSPPSTDEGYTDLPLKKVINPAFASEVAHKWIRCKAMYSMTVLEMTDLPKEYQDGWVRIYIIDPKDVLAGTLNVIIPKAKSDIVSELKNGDVIEVFAYSEPIKTTVFERTVSRVLFIVDKIKKVK